MNRVKESLSLFLIIISLGSVSRAETPTISVIYPKPDQVITAVDSTFILGNVQGFDHKRHQLKVNGALVDVHKESGFLAFVPIKPGEFTFHLIVLEKSDLRLAESQLHRDKVISQFDLTVSVPVPLASFRPDSTAIVGTVEGPGGDLVLGTGEMLKVSFQSTPGLNAWFSIPDVVDSVPMVESDPQEQAYWGVAVFGSGDLPDSVLIRGIYTGYYIVPESASVRSSVVHYHLATWPKDQIRRWIAPTPHGYSNPQLIKYLFMDEHVVDSSEYRVSLNPPDYPFVVRFSDSVQTIRHRPRLGYFSIFQPEGVEALVIGREGGWYKAQLSPSQIAWVDSNAVERLPYGHLPPVSQLFAVRTYSSDSSLRIELPLKGKHPYRVIVDNRRLLRLQLFGVVSNTDWIRYDFSDDLIDIATWSQPEPRLYELTLTLTTDLWGYDAFYNGNQFVLELERAPQRIKSLWGKTIVVDPGHSADAGAVGPTGYTEAEANLGIALVLRDLLKREGANVVMTRDDMSNVPLYERPVIAKLNEADLFLSIHNNALPDGVNPFENNGVSAYYYHPHSIDLAKAIQKRMVEATRLNDHGLFHGNLAVNRPTQYPAVLIECAFMMIPEQESNLKRRGFRTRVARAIVAGVEDFLKEYDRRNR